MEDYRWLIGWVIAHWRVTLEFGALAVIWAWAHEMGKRRSLDRALRARGL